MRILSEMRTKPAASRLAFVGRQLQDFLTYQLYHAPRGRIVTVLAAVTLLCLALHGLKAVAAVFALRLRSALLDLIHPVAGKCHLRLWFVVFVLMRLQMTTALRPIVGRSDTFLPTKKLFFLAHWSNNLHGGDE